MKKRIWLWKRRSSLDKSPAEGESEISDSMSSQSEKCSEEQEWANGSPNHNTQSPEVTSKASGDECNKENHFTSKNSLLKKLSEADQEDLIENNSTVEATPDEAKSTAAPNGKEESESVKLLKEKLSAALINVSLKDELVQQHTKVAEEAVAGWEKAENEVGSLKQQLDSAVQQNSALEARLSHLDQALKECVRQLRLTKDEQEQKISEALAEKSNEFELYKSKLESWIVELQAKVEASSASSPVLVDPEIHLKLEFLERENQRLEYELAAQSEELEIRTIERDLSTKAAETASKQHLESFKMVAKLESECRKLKALSRKSPFSGKGHKSPSTPSYSIDSVTNSQSDDCEPARSDLWATPLIAKLDQIKNEKSLGTSSVKIDLMDDFLEMEKLAAMPENGLPRSESPQHPSTHVESLLRQEMKAITSRAAELEEKVRKMEAEKVELEMASSQSQMSFENLQVELIETKMQLEQLEGELHEANELKMDYESYTSDLKLEAQAMMSKIEQLQAEVDRQRVSTEKLSARCQELDNELCMKNEELEVQRDAACGGDLEEKKEALVVSRRRVDELEIEIKEAMMKLENRDSASRSELDEKEMALAESRKCLEALQIKLREAEMKLETQNALYNSEFEEKGKALAQSQERLNELQIQLKEAEKKLHEENESKERLLSELASSRGQVETISAQIDTLQTQIDKQHGISVELSAKCEELEKQLKQKEQELELRQNVPAFIEQKINQDDVANTAGKLAECQKTIASLGNQLKSLATLEDFLIDTASIPGFSGSAPLTTEGGSEMWKLHLNNVYLPQKRCVDHFQDPEDGLHTFSKYVDGDVIESSSSSATNLFNCSSSDKRGNGFEKLFPMRRG